MFFGWHHACFCYWVHSYHWKALWSIHIIMVKVSAGCWRSSITLISPEFKGDMPLCYKLGLGNSTKVHALSEVPLICLMIGVRVAWCVVKFKWAEGVRLCTTFRGEATVRLNRRFWVLRYFFLHLFKSIPCYTVYSFFPWQHATSWERQRYFEPSLPSKANWWLR